jgi:hypothetical protein
MPATPDRDYWLLDGECEALERLMSPAHDAAEALVWRVDQIADAWVRGNPEQARENASESPIPPPQIEDIGRTWLLAHVLELRASEFHKLAARLMEETLPRMDDYRINTPPRPAF